jgi:hypothetical protein
MAMRRRLWSVSALSVELNKDRRTVAKILDGVMPDGKERGHDAWHLETVLLALDASQEPPSATPAVLEHFIMRLRDWREIYDRPERRMNIDEMAAVLGADRDQILTWLRAGCPCVTRGDFESGDGFELNSAHVIDWTITLGALARGYRDAMGELRLGLK